MVTVNNENNSTDDNYLIIDQIKLLIDRYNNKQIKQQDIQNKLTFYAKKSGFINNTFRKQAWKLLINSSNDHYSTGKLFIFLFLSFTLINRSKSNSITSILRTN